VGNRKPPTANRGDDDDFASNAAAGCRHSQHDDGRNKRPGTGTLQSKSPPGKGVDLAGGVPLFTDGVRSASSSGDAEVSACDGGERKGAKGGGDRQQRPQQQRHEGGSSCVAVSGTRNFYDPYRAAQVSLFLLKTRPRWSHGIRLQRPVLRTKHLGVSSPFVRGIVRA